MNLLCHRKEKKILLKEDPKSQNRMLVFSHHLIFWSSCLYRSLSRLLAFSRCAVPKGTCQWWILLSGSFLKIQLRQVTATRHEDRKL